MSGFLQREHTLIGGNLLQVAAMAAAIFISWQGIMAVPVQIGAVIDGLGVSEQESGFLGSIEIFTLAIVSILLATKITMWPKVKIAFTGLAFIVIGQFASSQVADYMPLLAFRVLVGIGAGLLYGAACAAIAGVRNGERLYAWGTSASQVLTAIMLATLPLAGAYGYYKGVYMALGILAVVFGLLFLSKLPENYTAEDVSVNKSKLNVPLSTMLMLFASIALFNIAIGTIWSYTDLRADEIGMDPNKVGLVLAFLPIGGICGAILAGIVGFRFGYTVPLVIGGLACMVSSFAIGYTTNETILFASVFGLGFFELFVFPFLIGTAASLDNTGKLATTAGGVSILAYSMGPVLGGVVSTNFSMAVVCVFSAVLCLLMAIIIIPVGRSLESRE